MSRSLICMLLALSTLLSLLSGCGGPAAETTAPTQETTEATEPPLPIPPDGNPNDVTCKGTYLVEGDLDAVVARAGEAALTNRQLQAWYWAEIGSYRASGENPAPDFSQRLDIQPCGIDESVNSWQQFFLRRALNNWHSAQAISQYGAAQKPSLEKEYAPNEKLHTDNMTDMPATKYLYGYRTLEPNSMHQAWLDNIPAMLEELAQQKGCESAEELARKAFGTDKDSLAAFAEDYNRGYIYYTNLSYYIEHDEEAAEAYFAEHEQRYSEAGITKESGNVVTIRHMLLVPTTLAAKKAKDGVEDKVTINEDGTVNASDERWEACIKKAKNIIKNWKKDYRRGDGSFGNVAFQESQDTGTALDGGAYRNVTKGQLIEPVDAWCFDESRKAEDIGYVRSEYGIHILFFTEKAPLWQARVEADMTAEAQADLLTTARSQFPMEVSYRQIVLTEAEASVSLDEVLYPDVAHERFPEIPLYLQQDYPKARYGNFLLRTHGCGITTLAMVASYMADDELTPVELAARYGNYCSQSGTDGLIFQFEAGALGFYLRKKSHDVHEVKAALEEGQVVVSLQRKGYWTRGGHYIALEKMLEDGRIQVRDSNLANYGRIREHKNDSHTWGSITNKCAGYWIYEDKVTRIPLCVRCGDPEKTSGSPMTEDYLCHKCTPALQRRNSWLALSSEG